MNPIRRTTSLRRPGAFLVASLLASPAFAQTFPEVEPNSTKAEATLVNGIAAGGVITGTTTGTNAFAGDTALASVDTFRVKTGALPLGVYQHTLTVTSTTVGHTGTIRGFSQVAGVINTTTDVVAQTSITTPTRSNVWYGFGKQEEIYYRVSGAAATTAAYSATLTTVPITPIAVAGTFNPGTITVTTVGQGHGTDTEIYVYDANLNPVPFGHNDDPVPQVFFGPSTVSLTLAPGTYYAAISTYNTANDQSDANPNETYQAENVLDFPNAMMNNATGLNMNMAFAVSDGGNMTQVPAMHVNAFDIAWAQFTVAVNTNPPMNDNCAAATAIGTGTVGGILTYATNDGTASCDTGGASSRDAWFSYTNSTVNPLILSANTCGSSFDTVLSIHSGCGGIELACNDDCGGGACVGTSSCTTAPINPGQTLLIRVGDKGLGGGIFSLHVDIGPAGDSCAAPIVLAGPGLYPIDNSLATTGVEGQNEAMCSFFGGTAVPKDLWFTYTPTANTLVTVSTCGSIPVPPSPSTDSKIAIYAGAGCPTNGTAVACNDDAGTGAGSSVACAAAGFNSTIEFNATCGVTYTIQIGMYWASTSSILGQFSVTEAAGTPCATPVTYFCFGDGSGIACPCANNGAVGNGCANSLNANGGNLAAIGNASVSADTWVLSGTGIPNGPGLYYQALNALGGGNGVLFGDGIRCIGGTVIRLGIVTAAGNASTYPSGVTPPNGVPISIKGFNSAGDVRNYQLWYRDSTTGFCTVNVFNLTNAVNVTWQP